MELEKIFSNYIYITYSLGFSGDSDSKEHACNVGEPEFDPWVRMIPWRKAWQPIPYSCLENPKGQRSLVGYSP